MKTTLLLFLTILLSLFLWCGKEYNPFTDYSNAAISITRQTIHTNDTTEIFHAETLTVVVLVKELMDRFRVRCLDNRLWNGPDTVFPGVQFKTEPFILCFSMCDTGRHSISITAFKTNGTADSAVIDFYVKSPLHQNSLVCGFGDSILLRTPPVRDRDAYYYWSFGSGQRVSSLTCTTAVTLLSVLLSGRGALWVSDGAHASCADSFNFTVRDTTKPDIVCVNENFVGKDTVYTGDSVFNFKVRITDRGDQWVDSASISGAAFDRTDDKVYYALIDKMQTHDSLNPLSVTVYALDHFQYGNSTVKKFTLIFSTAVGPALPAKIVVLNPSRDSINTMIQRFTISGIVENHAFDSMNLIMLAYVNDSLNPAVQTITNKAPAWNWTIDLLPGPNRVRLIAKERGALSTVDQTNFTIFYLDTAHDTSPPIIAAIKADNSPANNQYTDKSTVFVTVNAFDEISGIDSLFINGRPAAPTATGNWFGDSVALRHVPSGNEIIVRAKDRKGNTSKAEAIVYRNRRPVIQRLPKSSFIAIDSAFTDTLLAFDPDADTLSFQITAGVAGLSINQQGSISWKPTQRDTGMHTINIRIFDGYQPVSGSFTLYVFGDLGHPGPIRFATKPEDFPTYLEADKDTLRKTLRCLSNTGIRPFRFSARIANKAKTIANESPDSLITWAPLAADTGFQQLMIVVKDAFPSADTLYPRILVVMPNRPCSLSVSFSAALTATGAANLNRKRDKDTLVFHIKDPDGPLVERHDVSLYETRTQLRNIIDSAVVDSFSLVVDPMAFDGYDTIIAAVRDRAGHTDTLKQPIYYGMPPYSPQAVYPLNLQSITGKSISLSWQDIDPDNDNLTYDVYFGSSTDQMTLQSTTTATAATITGLTAQRNYYWKIIAHDWKSFTEGPTWQFTTR